jgi:AhpD family alkylhydroperoxidase
MSAEEFQAQFPTVHDEILECLQAGMVPGIFRAMTQANPSLAYTTWLAVRDILCKGEVPRLMKELILTVVANSRNCKYCETAHFAIACRLGTPKEVVQLALDNLPAVNPEATRAAIQFGIDLTHNNQLINEAYYANMERAGLDRKLFPELLAMVGLANLLVSYADALMVKPDQAFLDDIAAAA